MLGPHYTLKSSTKKKGKKGGNIAIDFYDQGDSRCSSSVGQHTHDELKNASLVNIKFAGIEGDGSLSTNLNTAKKGALRMAEGVRHPGVRKGGKNKRPVSRHHMQTMKSSVGNSKKNPRSKSNYHTTDFRTGAQFRENGLDQASFHQSIYKLREMIQQNEHQSKGRKSKKRKAVKNDRNYSSNMKGRLDQSYTGDLTPNSFFCTDYRFDDSTTITSFEDHLRKRIQELDSDRQNSVDPGTISDKTTATVHMDEKRIALLNQSLEELGEHMPQLASLFYLLRDGYEDSTRRIMMGERGKMNQLSEEVIRLQKEIKQLKNDKRQVDLQKYSKLEVKNKMLESQLRQQEMSHSLDLKHVEDVSKRQVEKFKKEAEKYKQEKCNLMKEIKRMRKWEEQIVERIDLDELDLHTDRLGGLFPPQTDRPSSANRSDTEAPVPPLDFQRIYEWREALNAEEEEEEEGELDEEEEDDVHTENREFFYDGTEIDSTASDKRKDSLERRKEEIIALLNDEEGEGDESETLNHEAQSETKSLPAFAIQSDPGHPIQIENNQSESEEEIPAFIQNVEGSNIEDMIESESGQVMFDQEHSRRIDLEEEESATSRKTESDKILMGESADSSVLDVTEPAEPISMPSLKLSNLNQKPFQEEFMDLHDEFSESWRQQIAKDTKGENINQ